MYIYIVSHNRTQDIIGFSLFRSGAIKIMKKAYLEGKGYALVVDKYNFFTGKHIDYGFARDLINIHDPGAGVRGGL